jgi:hypothetical protein
VFFLLHGWRKLYDIKGFSDAEPLLKAKGYRVNISHLLGHSSTRYLSEETMKNG